MNLLEIKCGNNTVTCEDTIEDIQTEMKLDGDFITVNECYWGIKEGTGAILQSKRRRKMILKSRIIEITEL